MVPYKRIESFEDIILFELQKLIQAKVERRLSFSKIWRACAAAAPNIPGAPLPGVISKRFAHKVITAIENLEGLNLATIHTSGFDRSKRITHITPTTRGVEYLQSIIFTHQEVLRAGAE